MTNYTDGGIPKREVTLQYQPLGSLAGDDPETDDDTPSVAGGTEIKLFAETFKEIFQKEPTTIPIQKGKDSHYQGDKTQIVDSMKAKHKFEVSAWVYSNRQGKHSLDDSILINNGEEAQISNDKLKAEEFNQYIPLGDTGIKYMGDVTRADAETVKATDDGGNTVTLKRGFKDGIVDADTTNDNFVVAEDRTDFVSSGDNLRVTELAADGTTTGNDGDYTVSSASYSSSNDETTINVNESVGSTSTDGDLAVNDYRINYSRGEIKFLDTGTLNSTTEKTKILGKTINTTTVISDELQISYTFDASAQNIARLVRRMSQLGNPFVMRVDKNEYSAPSGEDDSHDYLVIPKKVSIASQSSKPAEYKLELELRKGTIEL